MGQGAPGETVEGLVVVDKPAGCTSHDVVARMRRIYGLRRVRHAGTLDPDATGVLLVGPGRATRPPPFLTATGQVDRGEAALRAAPHTPAAAGPQAHPAPRPG